jgi:hypothetical protein
VLEYSEERWRGGMGKEGQDIQAGELLNFLNFSNFLAMLEYVLENLESCKV